MSAYQRRTGNHVFYDHPSSVTAIPPAGYAFPDDATRTGTGAGSAADSLTLALVHELTQPLTAIVSYAGACVRLLRGTDPTADAKILCAVESIQSEARRSVEVVTRMRALVLSGSPTKSVVAVDELLDEALGVLRLSVDTSGVTFTCDVPPTVGSVCVDAVLVRQVVFNLLRNAVQAIVAGGHCSGSVRIEARRRTANVEIAIEDDGPGLPELPPGRKLFERRVTTKSGGMGMGLMLSRLIIEAHGGDLWADPACGDGATFRFTLPVEPR